MHLRNDEKKLRIDEDNQLSYIKVRFSNLHHPPLRTNYETLGWQFVYFLAISKQFFRLGLFFLTFKLLPQCKLSEKVWRQEWLQMLLIAILNFICFQVCFNWLFIMNYDQILNLNQINNEPWTNKKKMAGFFCSWVYKILYLAYKVYCVQNLFKILYPLMNTVLIQSSWLLMKAADQNPHCLSSIMMNPYSCIYMHIQGWMFKISKFLNFGIKLAVCA